jgi:rod shape-determining protein MreC
MTTMSFRRAASLILVFMIISGSFIVLDRRSYLDPVRSGLNEVVAPVSSTFYDLVDRPGSQSALEAELATVTAERDAALAENTELGAENAALAQQVQEEDAESRLPGVNLIEADVFSRDPSGTQMSIQIDVGSEDGVRVGMAIVSPYYYVGQVVEVTEQTSKVMLIVDASQSVGAMLLETRADGIVYGQWQQGGYLTLLHVRADTAPQEGEMVVTSEFSQTQTRQVPPNIMIGEVVGEPAQNAQTDTLEIRIRPGVSDFNSLTTVYVAVVADE